MLTDEDGAETRLGMKRQYAAQGGGCPCFTATVPGSLVGVYSNHHFIHLGCHITKIKVFCRLSIRGKHIFPRAWNTSTKSVGKWVASGCCRPFSWLAQAWPRLCSSQGHSLAPLSACICISPELSYLHVPTGSAKLVEELGHYEEDGLVDGGRP